MTSPNPEVDVYIDGLDRWQAETRALRSILLDCELDEELKWRQPCYTFQGGNVAIIQGFNAHCSLMFFKGALLEDPTGVLVPPGENSRAARRVELTSVAQIEELEPLLRRFVHDALAVERAGRKVEPPDPDDLELPEELEERLEGDPELAEAFQALTPGRQRGYVLHFSGAKQSRTRAARIERAVERILAGKGLHDR